MGDYIDRKKVAELLCEMICGSDRALCVSACENCRQKWMEKLYDIPTITVRGDVHGKWVRGSDEEICLTVKCSVCGIVQPLWAKRDFAFCPDCGAKMDKE